MTAVIVAHDGVTWLPQVADAVLEQTRPVQRVVAVDTGSRDRSGAVLAAKFGRAAVFGMDRTTGFGAAIARALQHGASRTPVPAQSAQAGQRTEWLWLLHDDCEPAADALEQLLRGTVETGSAAVLGPKIRDWASRDVVLEAGVTLDTVSRRVTGIEPREVDQGQHDGDRDALAVSSAGMLVRRDVWERVGGFDTAMGLFMEDIDFCWRVHAAGYRVRVITDAVVYHAQAAARRKRAISVGRRARMLDRRNGLLTLLGNLPMRPMLAAAAGNIAVSLLRVVFFLLAKRLGAAVDELSALCWLLCHPIRLIKARSRRSRGRRAAFSRIRGDLPPGHSARRLAEFVLAMLSRSQPAISGSHHATEDPAEDDSMLVDNGLGKRLLTSPTLLMVALLTGISLAACWSLIGSGPLGGGSLVPAWGGSGSLWASYIQTFHPAGIGSITPAPPWLPVIAALATVLGGKPWLAIDVILIGCVPLSGLTAMFAVRKIATSGLVRAWVCVTYALLPVAMGVIAAGRFGTAVAFVLLPLIVAQAGLMVTRRGPRATRAAWAAGLLVAIGSAFVPLLWVIALLACVLAAVVFRATRPGLLRNLAIVALTAPVLLLPWTLTLISNPTGLLLEAGVPQSGAPAFSLPARSLLLLSPGGPGLPPYWVSGGLLAVAFAALFTGRRRRLVIAGWGVALCGLFGGVVFSHLIVKPADGGLVTVWPGLPLALAAIGLLMASAVAADGLGQPGSGRRGWRTALGGRGPWVPLLGLVACTAPVLAAASWLINGVSGPVHRVSEPVVPELVAAAGGQGRQVRTLVLRSAGGHLSYLLLRGPSPSLAEAALNPPADARRALDGVVSALTTPGGSLAVSQAQLLAEFDIGYVLVQAPVDTRLAAELNDVSGLQPYSTTGKYSLWQLSTLPSRVAVREPGGRIVPVTSGAVGVPGVAAPAAGGTLMLAEPAGGWHASVGGHALAAVPSPAGSWAQAFRLPPGGGTLTIGHSGLTRDLLLILELLAFMVVGALALPGIHVAEQEGAIPAAADQPDGQVAGRRAGHGKGRASARRAATRGAPAGSGLADAGSAGTGSFATDHASAPTAVMDNRDGARADLAATGRAGSAGAEARGAADDGAAEAEAEVAAGRRGLARAGRGRSRQVGRGTRGRGGRTSDAAGPRAGRKRGSGAALTAAGTAASPDGDQEGATTLLNVGSGAGDHGRRGESPAGRGSRGRDGGRDGRLADAWPDGADSDRDDGKLADAWPYNADAWPYDMGDSSEPGRGAGDPRHSGQRSYRAPGDPANDLGMSRRSGQYPLPGDLDAPSGPRAGRRGYRADRDMTGEQAMRDWPGGGPPGQARTYPEDAGRDFTSRGGDHGRAGGRMPGDGLDFSQDRPAPGRRSPSGLSPSGRSPGGDWPRPEPDAFAVRDLPPGRSPSGRGPEDSLPGLDTPSGGSGGRTGEDRDEDLPPWRAQEGTRAYRLTGPGQARRSAAGTGQDQDRDTQPRRSGPPPVRSHGRESYGRESYGRESHGREPYGGESYGGDSYGGDSYGGQPDHRARGRHSAGHPDELAGRGGSGGRGAGPPGDHSGWDTGSGPLTWPGAGGGELEPLPPMEGRRRGPGGRGSPHADEDTGDWARFDDEPAGRGWRPAPADYEPEYEGDGW